MTWNRQTTEQQRVQRKRDYLNQRNVHVQQIPHLRDSFAFLPHRKDSVTDLNSFGQKSFCITQGEVYRLQRCCKFLLLWVFIQRLGANFRADHCRFNWCFCICYIHTLRHSQGFKGDCEAKRTFPVIPWKLDIYQVIASLLGGVQKITVLLSFFSLLFRDICFFLASNFNTNWELFVVKYFESYF